MSIVRLPAFIRLLRPRQWVKNLLVFAAPLFALRLATADDWIATLLAFVCLCAVSSGIYALNDALDADRDRNHPTKKKRPIAAGEISQAAAYFIASAFLGFGLVFSLVLGTWFFAGMVLFTALQLGYNFGLKRIPVVDVFAISFAFVLRAVLGAVAVDVSISGWLLFCTGALALLLGSAKRRHELLLMQDQGSTTRPALDGYNERFADIMVAMSAALAAISFGIYAISSSTAIEHPALVLTAPIVIFGIARYLYAIYVQGGGGEPEAIMTKDPWMVGTIVLFIGVTVFALTGGTLPFIAEP